MLAWFDHIQNQPDSSDVAFVTALLLVQKKLLTLRDDGGDESRLYLQSRTNKTTWEIPVVNITPDRLIVIQEELSDRLFTDEPISQDSQSGDDENASIEEEIEPGVSGD